MGSVVVLFFADADGDALTLTVSRVGGNGTGAVSQFVSVSGFSVIVGPRQGMPGEYVLGVAAVDGRGGSSAVSTLTVTVSNTAPALAQSLPAVPLVTEGAAFAYSFPRDLLVDADGDSVVHTASLPSFLAFDAGLRQITATPARAHAGNHNLTITAQDPYGAIGRVSAVVTVNAHPVADAGSRGGWATSASPLALSGVGVAVNVSVPVLFTDPDGDAVAYSVSDGSQAPWAALTSRDSGGGSGVGGGTTWWLTGVPDRNAHAPVTVYVVGSDGRGGVSAAVAVVMTVANTAPVAADTALGPQSVPVGSVAVVSVPASAFADADGDALTLTVSRVGGNGTGAVSQFVSVSSFSVIVGPRQGMQGEYVLGVAAVDGRGGSSAVGDSAKHSSCTCIFDPRASGRHLGHSLGVHT